MGKSYLDSVNETLERTLYTLDHCSSRGRGMNIIKAINTGDFLRQIFHKGYIITPRWYSNMIAAFTVFFAPETQTIQDFYHFISRNVCTQTIVNLSRDKVNEYWLFLFRINIYNPLGNCTSPHVLQQLSCSIQGSHSLSNVNTTLKSARCLRVQTTCTGGTTNAGTIEGSRLQYYSSSVLCNLGLQTAHYTGQASRLFAISNNQFLPFGNTRRIIQGVKIFSGYCLAGCKAMTGYLVIIIGVHRLTQLYHNEISYVYNIINGTNPCIFQTCLHPLRRLHNLYIF